MDTKIKTTEIATVDLSRTERAKVSTFAEASAAVRHYIEVTRQWLPSSKFHGGKIRDAKGKVVAEVSYNGRVWMPDDTEVVL